MISIEKIKRYHGPVLLSHGDADRTIPYSHGEALFAAAPGPQKRFFRHVGGGHNDPQPEEYRAMLEEFLAQLPPYGATANQPRRADGDVIVRLPQL